MARVVIRWLEGTTSVANDRRQTGVVNCCWVRLSPGECGGSFTWELGTTEGVGEEGGKEPPRRRRRGREWLSYSEQCLVRRFALR